MRGVVRAEHPALQRLFTFTSPAEMEDLIDLVKVRERTAVIVTRLGYPLNPDLPLLDLPTRVRSREAIISRMLCVHLLAACAYGFDRGRAAKWIAREGLRESLSREERTFLDTDIGDPRAVSECV